MKNKILIAIFTLMLSSLFIVSLASNKKETYEDVVAQNNNNDVLINSPLFTSKENYNLYKGFDVNFSVPEAESDFKLAFQNDNFKLYYDSRTGKNATGAIRIVDLKTGYVWCSDIPDVENEDKYGSITPSVKKDMKSSMKLIYVNSSTGDYSNNIAYTTDGLISKITVNNNSISYDVYYKPAKISLTYVVTLTSSGIDVDLPASSIKEEGDFMIKQVSLFSFLGSTYNKAPGYLFMPSGNGALVRFDRDSVLTSDYVVKYYGSDENVTSNDEYDNLSLPIYGVTHGVNQNAMFTRIKSGSSMANFVYEPTASGDIFNRVYNAFVYRETSNIKIPGGNTLNIIDEEFCNLDVSVSYSFLNGDNANYVGMALKYQQDIVSEYNLKQNEQAGSTNVHVDVFGGETEKGILFDKFVKMTTTSQLIDINTQLTNKLNNNLKYTLRGYYKKGYSYQTYNNIKFNSKLGNLSDLDEAGLDYVLYYNPVESYSSSLNYPGNVLVNMSSNKHYVMLEENVKYKFYTNVDSVISGVNSAVEKYEDVAIDALGYRLYGDTNANYRRHDVVNKYLETLGDAKYSLYKPNEYLFANTSEYFNAQLYHGKLRFITDSVPFIQMALRGYIDYYSTYINFSTNQDIDVLKCIEYGSNLAYLVSYEQSHLLSNSLSNHLYATHFESNKMNMIEQINYATEALSGLNGCSIVNRSVLDAGVVEVTYSNGTKIYVNYTNSDYSYNNIVIESMNYYKKEV